MNLSKQHASFLWYYRFYLLNEWYIGQECVKHPSTWLSWCETFVWSSTAFKVTIKLSSELWNKNPNGYHTMCNCLRPVISHCVADLYKMYFHHFRLLAFLSPVSINGHFCQTFAHMKVQMDLWAQTEWQHMSWQLHGYLTLPSAMWHSCKVWITIWNKYGSHSVCMSCCTMCQTLLVFFSTLWFIAVSKHSSMEQEINIKTQLDSSTPGCPKIFP